MPITPSRPDIFEQRTSVRPAPSKGILHIAGWYPGPWSKIEGNFIQAQLRLFLQEAAGSAIVVQVRQTSKERLRLRLVDLEDGVRAHYLLTRLPIGRLTEILSTLLLLCALLRARAWRYDVLHFHIAYPLLIHVRFWRWLLRKPIIISEHWSAYHFDFYLPSHSKALARLRTPFQQGFPVFAVSNALLDDLRRFSGRDDLSGYVIPNVVPLHGATEPRKDVPVLFCVSRWVDIKDPMPMLAGLTLAMETGARFELVIGGFGELLEPMKMHVANSKLACCTRFVGEMTKADIAAQLRLSAGYLFSSLYETFSVACAEALGAGVPLIGPHIPAIAEYAGHGDWQLVERRDAAGWAGALAIFLKRFSAGEFDRSAIADRAATRFSPEAIRTAYRAALGESLIPSRGSPQGEIK